MVCRPYNLSWFISIVTTRTSTSLSHKYSKFQITQSEILPYLPQLDPINEITKSSLGINLACMVQFHSNIINTNKYFKYKRIGTKLRWWTRVRTFNSARNSFVACISIFLIAAFCVSKIIGLYNESMCFKKKNRVEWRFRTI